MGCGLAEVTARAGFDVVVRSRTQARADAVLAGIDTGLSKQVSRERISESDRDSILARISVTDDLHKVGDCDLVIESVVEDMDVKRDLFSRLDEIVRSDAILATNTSTLAVVELAMATKHPERVCGIHFFNPAPMMKLVEVIAPLTASDATIEDALGFARDCGKDAVQVQDRAGFIVNALLFPYLNNAIRMWEQGTASMDDIDTAMQGGCNFPMGPFALLDLVGLDTSLAILDALYEEFRDPNFAAAPALRRMVSAGHLGRKTKHGFRTY
jgi:3-hydroxybutyryl-CoA dehydrogenase